MSNSSQLEQQGNKSFFQSFSKAHVTETTKYAVVLFYAIIILISGFFFNSTSEIISGLKAIIVSRSVLISDYMVIGNIGAALVNCGLTTIASLAVAKVADVEMTGPVVAAMFTIAAFALFGKNVYNIWGIYFGVYLNAVYTKERFRKYAVPAFFGTALGPLISQITFGLGLPLVQGIIFGNLAGILAGFMLPYLAAQFPKFHQGFNLYNIGFTAGMTGFLFMSLLKALNRGHDTLAIALEGYNFVFSIYFTVMFITMIILGYIINDKSFSGYGALLDRTGQAITDFIALDGFGLTLINMGIIGIISVAYVLLVKGELNGPNIGGVLTVVAFGAFGKHTKNIIPILIGVFLASRFMPGLPGPGELAPVLAALFGTTLAPLAGDFGWLAGIIAGFVHMLGVVNTAGLHGGMDLYNNGFTGGLVAACLAPVFYGIFKSKTRAAEAAEAEKLAS